MMNKWSKAVMSYMREHASILWMLGVYGGLTLLIMLPLLMPGYILTLDLVFTPHMPWPDEVTNTYILEVFLWMLHELVPGDVVEKLVLILVLVLSGIGAHRLTQYLKPKQAALAGYWHWAAYFAGIFYMVNPFIYARFMAGQWMVLLGYAVLPFVVHALLRLMQTPSWATAWRLGVWMFVIGVVSIHHVGIAGLVVLVACGVVAWEYRRDLQKLMSVGRALLMSFGVAIAASAIWLVPTIMGMNAISKTTANFGDAHFAGFATLNGPLGAVGEVLRLRGFWAEGYQLFTLPNDVVSAWGVIALGIWIIVAVGVKYAWPVQRRMVLILGISGIIAIVLAATSIIEYASHIVPFIGGYREPHKFINILTLGFAILGGAGVAALMYRWRTRTNVFRRVMLTGMLVLPLIFTPTMLWGFGGQLTPRQYPDGWQTMNAFMNQEADEGKILFLPWHQYLWLDFADRTVANPADKYFERDIIVSDNLAFNGVPPTVPDAEKRQIADILEHSYTISQDLRALDIRYILLFRQNPEDYPSMTQIDTIHPLKATDTLMLYRLEVP